VNKLLVAGLPGSGKTHLILSLMAWVKAQGISPAAFKPFEVAGIAHNATETPTDGERYAQMMSGEPLSTLINPYIANEDYPVELAFRRDGIKMQPKLLADRQQILLENYGCLFVELPAGLAQPISETQDSLDWALEQEASILYLIRPGTEPFTETLLEIARLKASGANFMFAFSNASDLKDGDWIFYQWEKLEAAAAQQAEGMLPHQKDPQKLVQGMDQYLPKLTGLLLDKG